MENVNAAPLLGMDPGKMATSREVAGSFTCECMKGLCMKASLWNRGDSFMPSHVAQSPPFWPIVTFARNDCIRQCWLVCDPKYCEESFTKNVKRCSGPKLLLVTFHARSEKSPLMKMCGTRQCSMKPTHAVKRVLQWTARQFTYKLKCNNTVKNLCLAMYSLKKSCFKSYAVRFSREMKKLLNIFLSSYSENKTIRTHLCIRTHNSRTHAYVHAHAHAHTYMHLHTRTHTYTCLHTRTHTHTRTHARTHAHARFNNLQRISDKVDVVRVLHAEYAITIGRC